ncbi:MAG TPA: ATP-binding protein [Burkholderiaceae bacterium]|nr:ATP-binding protein [Burkholderiaceae bacterium]
MPAEPVEPFSERVVVAAPTLQDGLVTQRLMSDVGIECSVERDLTQVIEWIERGAGALLITDLAAADPKMPALMAALDRQPDWSGLPVIAICRDVDKSRIFPSFMESMANVTVVDRPVSVSTLVSALRAALRNRRSQYQIRDQLLALRRAREALSAADKRKDEFLATLAHELRNPLAPLKTGIELLQSTASGDPQVKSVLPMMDRQMTHLVKLVDDLLDVSRITSGKIVLNRERLDLRSVVQLGLESCEPTITASRHRLVVRMPPEPVWITGDSARLAQVVLNVVGNAAKYTPAGGRIELRLEAQSSTATLTVADTGLGIPADMLDAVFDMFTQVNRSLDRSQGGLGIGLSLVKRLVELHDGSVQVSSPGGERGTTVEIRLPLAEAGEIARTMTKTERGKKAAPNPTRQHVLLVIDDNTDAADSLAMLLRALGHRTEVAYDGIAGLAAVTNFSPDVVFCDIGMPGMGGYAFAGELRRRGFQAITLVAVSGWGAEADKQHTRKAGFDFHLTKPADTTSLKTILEHLPS